MTHSDATLQLNSSPIDDVAAIAWSKKLAWVNFSAVVGNTDELEGHLLSMKARLADLMEGNSTSPTVVATKAAVAAMEDRLATAATKTTVMQAGLAAQQVNDLIAATGYGDFVVTNTNGIYHIDYNYVMAIVNRGLQLRLAAIEKFLSGVLGSNITI